MKKIKLTQGKYALVDDEDFERVNQFKWYLDYRKNKESYYVLGIINKRSIRLHQFIMGTAGNGMSVSIDHIDQDGLNNQKSNLRVCNISENMRNRGKHKDNTTGYKGVRYCKHANKYQARVMLNGKNKSCGYFANAIDAAKAYNAKALELHGEFAFLNIIEEQK